ncbi:unnamed protein product, partial [Rotaria sordida]
MHYGLRPKAMTEIRKIRRQLIQIVRNIPLATLLLDEPVFIHPSSVLINDLPSFVCYQEVQETNRIFIKDICAIQMDWIVQLNPHLCSFGPIEDDPQPRYDENQDK